MWNMLEYIERSGMGGIPWHVGHEVTLFYSHISRQENVIGLQLSEGGPSKDA